MEGAGPGADGCSVLETVAERWIQSSVFSTRSKSAGRNTAKMWIILPLHRENYYNSYAGYIFSSVLRDVPPLFPLLIDRQRRWWVFFQRLSIRLFRRDESAADDLQLTVVKLTDTWVFQWLLAHSPTLTVNVLVECTAGSSHYAVV